MSCNVSVLFVEVKELILTLLELILEPMALNF